MGNDQVLVAFYEGMGIGIVALLILFATAWLISRDWKRSHRSAQLLSGQAQAEVALEIVAEYQRARRIYPPFSDCYPVGRPHLGWATIQEEADELWDLVKRWPKSELSDMRREVVQIGAMALAFILEVCDAGKAQE